MWPTDGEVKPRAKSTTTEATSTTVTNSSSATGAANTTNNKRSGEHSNSGDRHYKKRKLRYLQDSRKAVVWINREGKLIKTKHKERTLEHRHLTEGRRSEAARQKRQAKRSFRFKKL